MIITEGTEFIIDKDTEEVELVLCSKPYFKFKGSIEAWLYSDPTGWKERVLRFETNYPIQVTGDLRTRSRIHTNYPLTVKGEDLRGEF